MTTIDRVSDETLQDYANIVTPVNDEDVIRAMARELLAHRRASQAAPAPSDGLREALLRWCDERQADVLGCIDLNASEEAAAVMWLNNFRAALSTPTEERQ